MSLEETVRRLQDRVDIQDLIFHYCRCADNLDCTSSEVLGQAGFGFSGESASSGVDI